MTQDPPFCPYPDCRHHHHPTAGFAQRHGTFRTHARRRPTQRFRCRGCGRTFSEQTFRYDFQVYRPELEQRLLRRLRQDERAMLSPRGLRLKVARLAERLRDGGGPAFAERGRRRPSGTRRRA